VITKVGPTYALPSTTTLRILATRSLIASSMRTSSPGRITALNLQLKVRATAPGPSNWYMVAENRPITRVPCAMMSPNRGVAYSTSVCKGLWVPDNIGVGDNQLLRYWDSLDNGLSNNEVRKVPWVHVRAVLNLLIPIIAAMLVTEFDHQRTFQVLHCGR